MSKLDELERLERAATKGEWRTHTLTVHMGKEVFAGEPSLETGIATPWHISTPRANANADLIALSRNMLPALIRVVRAAINLGHPEGHHCHGTGCERCELNAALRALES